MKNPGFMGHEPVFLVKWAKFSFFFSQENKDMCGYIFSYLNMHDKKNIYLKNITRIKFTLSH